MMGTPVTGVVPPVTVPPPGGLFGGCGVLFGGVLFPGGCGVLFAGVLLPGGCGVLLVGVLFPGGGGGV